MVEMGEAREQLGRDVWAQAEKFANEAKSDKPFYIVYHAKWARGGGTPTLKWAMKAYSQRPAAMLGILVWYVDQAQGIFRLVPELSAPPDVPLDPSLMSGESKDAFPTIMAQGQKLNALHS
jgi:hypothetical protein